MSGLPGTHREQRTRVAGALIEHRVRGISQHDFRLGATAIDDGPPIARLASRIEELRNDHGWRVDDAGWREGCKVYRLANGPAPEPPPRLFDPDPPREPN